MRRVGEGVRMLPGGFLCLIASVFSFMFFLVSNNSVCCPFFVVFFLAFCFLLLASCFLFFVCDFVFLCFSCVYCLCFCVLCLVLVSMFATWMQA
jgi:hypothetical protein